MVRLEKEREASVPGTFTSTGSDRDGEVESK